MHHRSVFGPTRLDRDQRSRGAAAVLAELLGTFEAHIDPAQLGLARVVCALAGRGLRVSRRATGSPLAPAVPSSGTVAGVGRT